MKVFEFKQFVKWGCCSLALFKKIITSFINFACFKKIPYIFVCPRSETINRIRFSSQFILHVSYTILHRKNSYISCSFKIAFTPTFPNFTCENLFFEVGYH